MAERCLLSLSLLANRQQKVYKARMLILSLHSII